MRENICKLSIHQGINTQSKQGTQKLSSIKMHNPILKRSSDLIKVFINGQQVYEKMLKYQLSSGKSNQNHNEIPCNPS
jgi:hypothetical protein